MPTFVTLTTDLGDREPPVAGIKGVLRTQIPDVQIDDLSHRIALHDVTEGALFVLGAIPYYPPGTIHLVTVAPGPTPVAARTCGQIVLCPDNGILTLMDDLHGIDEVRAIEMPESLCDRGGQIFFGREVFAPAAGVLASCGEISRLGPVVESLHRLDWPSPDRDGRNRMNGKIMHVDRFGNLVTNIYRDHLEGETVERVAAGHFSVPGLSQAYSDVGAGKPLALIGDTGYLEIAYNGDRANERLDLVAGYAVNVHLKK